MSMFNNWRFNEIDGRIERLEEGFRKYKQDNCNHNYWYEYTNKHIEKHCPGCGKNVDIGTSQKSFLEYYTYKVNEYVEARKQLKIRMVKK